MSPALDWPRLSKVGPVQLRRPWTGSNLVCMERPSPPPPPSQHFPPPAEPAAAAYQPPPRHQDGLGIAGFVVSLAGLALWLGLFLPLPITGLALSVQSLNRAGRTSLAVAGKVLGIIGCCLGGLWWVGTILAVTL